MNRWSRRIVLLVVSIFSCEVLATDRITGSLGGFYFTQTTGSEQTDSTDRTKVTTEYMFYDLGFCYTMGSFCLGAKYFAGTIDDKTTTSASSIGSKVATKYSGLGVKLGYVGDNLVVTYALIVDGKRENGASLGSTASGDVTYPMSSANTIDIGYGFKIGTVRFGPLLSLHHFEYKKREAGGVTTSLSQKQVDEFVMPYLAVWLDF